MKSLLLLLILTPVLAAQQLPLPEPTVNGGRATVGGYVEAFPLAVWPTRDDRFRYGNIIQARLTGRWFPREIVSSEISGRALIYSGEIFSPGLTPNPTVDVLGDDPGFLNLSDAWDAVLFGNIDRLWIGLTLGEVSVAIGRQRVNWGMALVWNPIDWYNAFEYLDFSYEERPGADAVRLTYFPGPVSHVEVVLEAGHRQEERTIAGMYRWNVFAYDFQIQAGLLGNSGAVGFGWSGDIAGGGFRGEISYEQRLRSVRGESVGADTSGRLTVAVSGDYTFASGLYAHTELLSTGRGGEGITEDFSLFSRAGIDERLYPAEYAVFGEVAYPVTSLLRATVASIVGFEPVSFFFGPSLALSLLQNVDFALFTQLFWQESGDRFVRRISLLAARLRYSF